MFYNLVIALFSAFLGFGDVETTSFDLSEESPPKEDMVPHGGLMDCIACPSWCLANAVFEESPKQALLNWAGVAKMAMDTEN